MYPLYVRSPPIPPERDADHVTRFGGFTSGQRSTRKPGCITARQRQSSIYCVLERAILKLCCLGIEPAALGSNTLGNAPPYTYKSVAQHALPF